MSRMNPAFHASLLLLILCLISIDATAQKRKVDCSGPRGVERAREVALMINAGERECEQAKAMMKEAGELRDLFDDLRKEASSYRKQAETNRKDARSLRKNAGDRRNRIERLQRESARLESALERERSVVAEPDLQASTDTLRLTIPAGGRTDYEEALSAYTVALANFTSTRLDGLDEEIQALEGLAQVDEELATDKEVTAVDFEQLATNAERAALEAETAASHAADAALYAERAALQHHVNASAEYIRIHLENNKAKRNVSRAVKYIEEHLNVLPADEQAEARDAVAEGKAAFDLK